MEATLRLAKHTCVRAAAKFAIDLSLWVGAWFVALLIIQGAPTSSFQSNWISFTVLSVAFKVALLATSKLYLQRWSQVSFRNAATIAATLGIGNGLDLVFLAGAGARLDMHLAVPVVAFAFALLATGAVRALFRFSNERGRYTAAPKRTRVVIVGAGEAGTSLAREMHRSPGVGYDPVAFVDDDASKRGIRIDAVEVKGAISDLANVLANTQADQVVVAIPTATGETLERILANARGAAREARHTVAVRVVPGMREILEGSARLTDLRDLRIEDLLRREPVDLRGDALDPFLHGRRILVTGAGGSIGSELSRLIAAHAPGRLILLGRGENSIFEVHQELLASHPDTELIPVIADIRNERRIDAIFAQHQPDIVFHAAAHKHVPLMEAQPGEAIENNVFGTKAVIDAAIRHGVKRFVNVSSDKAVRPTSIMGATKRIVELLVAAADASTEPDVAFVSVRFGNVLGSRGSVVPIFARQIAAGGPVTITDKRMTRYFMTIPEAAHLVLHTAAMAQSGTLYFLDMGEPVRIMDLAENLIRLASLEPDVDIRIVEAGMRPGEKLYEELTYEPGSTRTSFHPKVLAVAMRSGQVGNDAPLTTLLERIRDRLVNGQQYDAATDVMEFVRTVARPSDALQGNNGATLEPQGASSHPAGPIEAASTPNPRTQTSARRHLHAQGGPPIDSSATISAFESD